MQEKFSRKMLPNLVAIFKNTAAIPVLSPAAAMLEFRPMPLELQVEAVQQTARNTNISGAGAIQLMPGSWGTGESPQS